MPSSAITLSPDQVRVVAHIANREGGRLGEMELDVLRLTDGVFDGAVRISWQERGSLGRSHSWLVHPDGATGNDRKGRPLAGVCI